MTFNVLIGCDQTYFDKWATPLLQSIQHHNPWINLHCHVVNPTKENTISNVSITHEHRPFISDNSKISYLQSVRFLAVADKFSKNEYVVTLDADSICTRSMEQSEIENLFKKQYVLKHHKEDRWLAGFVVFNDTGFRQEYAQELKNIPVDRWEWGRDQTILNKLSQEYKFKMLPKEYMSIGKNKTNSTFLTLKGEQKTIQKYLEWYERYTL